MNWTHPTDVPPNNNFVCGRTNEGFFSVFYTSGKQVEIPFDDEVDYVDENDYLIEGWYKVYDHIDGQTYYLQANVIEWLNESPAEPDPAVLALQKIKTGILNYTHRSPLSDPDGAFSQLRIMQNVALENILQIALEGLNDSHPKSPKQ